MTFFGDTFRHREALDNAGLERVREEPAGDDGHADRPKRLETFYLMSSRDVSEAPEAAFVKNLLTAEVDDVIVDLRLVSTPDKDTAAYTFVESLKQIPNLLVSVI